MSQDMALSRQAVGAPAEVASRRAVPWQIWVVVLMLAVEGVLGNLPLMFHAPIAAVWLAAKCLFITGLLRRWRWVYVLFLVVAAIHVLVFSMVGPIVALLNLVLIILAASAGKFYFSRGIAQE
jgi:hypothetical protein